MAISKLKEKLKQKLKGRPKPSAPRAGFLASGRRYGEGGKISGKKNI